MQNFLVLLPILILAILESSIIPLNLVLLAIICWSVFRPAREGILTAFFAGLILDFLSGETLGFSSILFLVLSLLIYLYKNRFQANRFAFLLPFTLFSLIVIDLFEGFPIFSISRGFPRLERGLLAASVAPRLKTVIIEGVNTTLVIFLFPIFNFLAKLIGEEEVKLRIEG